MQATTAAIGLGSNLQEPRKQLDAAITAIKTLPTCTLLAKSSIYQSAPLGGMDQPDYFNAVVMISTTMDAGDLLRSLQGIEVTMGRQTEAARWSARLIDLDLLTYGQEQISEPDLQVPHPGIAYRNFVVLPLQEIQSDLQIPGLGRVGDIHVSMTSPSIRRLEDARDAD